MCEYSQHLTDELWSSVVYAAEHFTSSLNLTDDVVHTSKQWSECESAQWAYTEYSLRSVKSICDFSHLKANSVYIWFCCSESVSEHQSPVTV